MKTTWFKGLDEGEVEQLRGSYENAKVMRKRMIDMIDESIDSLQVAMRLDGDYDSPSWDKKQADRIGQLRTLNRIKNLL